MSTVGEGLTYLDLSGHTFITDTFLVDGIKANARVLTELMLSNVPSLTDEGVAEFFDTWAVKDEEDESSLSNPPLRQLDLSRNNLLSSSALVAILSHSGKTLTHLNINGWKATSAESLNQIATRAKELKCLDIGWCREMDDFIMKAIMEKCEKVRDIKAFGCNRLTEHCPRKVSFTIQAARAFICAHDTSTEERECLRSGGAYSGCLMVHSLERIRV
jgi:DNA repair protein RAD7